MIPCPVCAEELSRNPASMGSHMWVCWTCAHEVPDETVMRVRGSICAGDDCLNIIVPFRDSVDYLCVLCRHDQRGLLPV